MVKLSNWKFTGRTRHEIESDAQGTPSMLEKILDAAGVKDVSTFEPDTGISRKLAGEADVAEIIFCIMNSQFCIVLGATGLEARQTLCLMGYSTTLMSTLVHFLAWSNFRGNDNLFLNDHSLLINRLSSGQPRLRI